MDVKIRLNSSDIDFSEAISKKLDKISRFSFLGRPKENCALGTQLVLMTISNPETNMEYESYFFPVQVVDYAFGRVPRPFLANISTFFLTVGSLAMFLLTLVGTVDNTFGLTSGATAGFIAGLVHLRYLALYQQPSNKPLVEP
ncbi:MAG TPA: hypothetical protein VJ821_09535 [Anaerolineales bacterium]|nr:hypothetical protein [Anaerolineales bacterium]